MKKSEITFIRLMSLALIMVINAAVLLFFVGEHTFQNILNRMNSNVYDGGTLDTSIYNYYFCLVNTSIFTLKFFTIQKRTYKSRFFRVYFIDSYNMK